MKSNLFAEHVRPQIGAGHRASGKRLDGCAAFCGNLVPHAPVADNRLADTKSPRQGGHPVELFDCFGESFHVVKYHASCLRLSTLSVLDAHHSL